MSISSIAVDTHTHSVLSGHAYSTLLELIQAAKAIGLRKFVLTDHSYEMPGATPVFMPGVFPSMPKDIGGVEVVYGMELNILDFTGALDIKNRYIPYLQFGIASLHDVILRRSTEKKHTDALLGALEKPYVDTVGHPGNPYFECDIEAVVRQAKRFNKLIEINNHSFIYRKGSVDRCEKFLLECMKQDVRICVSSDAHFAENLGKAPVALEKLNAVGFPETLVVNATLERFNAYLDERARRMETAQ